MLSKVMQKCLPSARNHAQQQFRSMSAAAQFTITVRGQEKNFESSLTDAEAYDKIRNQNGDLASSLAERYQQSKAFGSDKQRAWAHYMATQDKFKSSGGSSKSWSKPAAQAAKPADPNRPAEAMSITRRGEEIKFSSHFTDEEVAERLRNKDDKFGKKLLEPWDQRRTFGSQSQRSWAHYIAQQEGFQGVSKSGSGGSSTWSKPAYTAPNTQGSAAEATEEVGEDMEVNQKGTDIKFKSALSDAEVAEKLKAMTTEFAGKLAECYNAEGGFGSQKRRAWAHYLVKEKSGKYGASRVSSYSQGQKQEWKPNADGGYKKAWGPPKPAPDRKWVDGVEIFEMTTKSGKNMVISSHLVDAEAFAILNAKTWAEESFEGSITASYRKANKWSPAIRGWAHSVAVRHSKHLQRGDAKGEIFVSSSMQDGEVGDELTKTNVAYNADSTLGKDDISLKFPSQTINIRRLSIDELLNMDGRPELAEGNYILEGGFSPAATIKIFNAFVSGGKCRLLAHCLDAHETAQFLGNMRFLNDEELPIGSGADAEVNEVSVSDPEEVLASQLALMKNVPSNVAKIVADKCGSTIEMVALLSDAEDPVATLRKHCGDDLSAYRARTICKGLGFEVEDPTVDGGWDEF